MLLSRLALVLHLATAAAVAEPLRFSLPEGGMQNEFYRDGPVAAHVVLRPGPEPRVVVAFPAGNSGAAVWFDAEGGPLAWKPDVAIEPASRAVEGGTLRGISAVLRASGGAIRVRDVVTGSIRVIREADDGLEPPPATSAEPRRADRGVTWLRRRIDGAPGYQLSIDVLRGRMTGGDGEAITLHPDARGEIELRVTALTGEPPLTPLPADELVDEGAEPDPHLRRILAYLSYREKLLAGSWQFATYFGRDTLMSLALLAPVAEPGLVEAGLGAVLERLNAAGEVAHEEAVGEFALLGRGPALDYKMIDDDFMLAAVAARLLLAPGANRARAAAFLARKTGNGETMGGGLVRNLRFVVAAAAPFARTPGWRRLIPLKDGESVGNWRDSNLGLGGGRYPYDVNGVLVPAALAAAAALRASGLLEPYLDEAGDAELARAATLAETWRREAPAMFDVALDADAARSGGYGLRRPRWHRRSGCARGARRRRSPLSRRGSRCGRQADRRAELGRGDGAVLSRSASVGSSARRGFPDSAVSRRTPDRRRPRRRESRLCRGVARAGIQPQPLPRCRDLVMAAGAPGCGH